MNPPPFGHPLKRGTPTRHGSKAQKTCAVRSAASGTPLKGDTYQTQAFLGLSPTGLRPHSRFAPPPFKGAGGGFPTGLCPHSRFASLTRFTSSNLRFARNEAIQIVCHPSGMADGAKVRKKHVFLKKNYKVGKKTQFLLFADNFDLHKQKEKGCPKASFFRCEIMC